MSAVFTGNGLGLFNTSLSQLGMAHGRNAGVGQGRNEQYVNLATGNLVWQGTDEHLVFRGLAVGFSRTYNSQGQLTDVGADGWTTGFERRLVLLSGTFNATGSVMRRYTGDGSFQDFVYAGPDEYRSPEGAGAHDSLTWDGDSWRYVEESTRREEGYASHADSVQQGRLTYIRDLRSDGATPTTWQVVYDAEQRIVEIRSEDGGTSGDALLFSYDASSRLSAISTREQGAVRQQVTYGYDGQGRLSSVLTDLTPENALDNTWDTNVTANNDGRLFRTEYSYIGTSLQLASVRQSDGTIVSYTYHPDGRLRTVTNGDANADDTDGFGETFTYAYAVGSTTITDAAGRTWIYGFDSAGQLTTVTSPPVEGQSDLTEYQYDAAGNLTQIRTIRGAEVLEQIDYAYDASGNVVWEWDGVGNAISRTWSSSNQLLSVTQYTDIDPDRAGSVVPAGASTTHYVYDPQDRLRFVIDALGNVTEHVYAATGAGIGQQSSTRTYLGAGYSGTHDLMSLQDWANNSQRVNSLLTELEYDAWGRLSQRVNYASVDALGGGVLDDATEVNRYIYDAQGVLRQRIVLHGTSRNVSAPASAGSEQIDYTYDGLGRLLGTIARQVGATDSDQSTLQTSYAYLDSGHQVAITDDAGRLTVQTRNAAGRLIATTERDSASSSGLTRNQSNYYDATGLLRATQDAGGGLTYFFYDSKGRLEGAVDATGAVSRTYYDGANRILETRQYTNRLSTTGWLVNGQVVPQLFDTLAIVADAAGDRRSIRTYDAAGRLETQTDGLAGNSDHVVTRYFYDGANRLVKVTSAGTVDPTDRTTRYFFDEAGQQIGMLDADYYLTESKYDRAGRLVEQTRYATRSGSEHWADGALPDLRPLADAANDQTTRHFYDGRGALVGTLDAQGYLTTWIHDQAGNVRAERRYSNLIAWSTGSDVSDLLPLAGTYREQRMVYNGLGQIVAETNAEGTVTRYGYDDAGRLVTTQVAYGTSDVREGNLRYNAFGELIGQLDGEGSIHLVAGMTESQLDAIYAQYGTRHNYDALGNLTESIDSDGNRTWYFYNALGQQTYLVRGISDASSGQILNAHGEVTEFRYTAFGEVREQIQYTNKIVLAIPGNRDAVLTALSVLTYQPGSVDSRRQYEYTTRGQVSSVMDAEGGVTKYAYDAFGQVIREDSAYGTTEQSTTTYAYTRMGRQYLVTDGVGEDQERTRQRMYDAFGRVIESRDYNNGRSLFAYDRLGRQLTSLRSAAARDEVTTSSYDAYGRVLTVVDGNGDSTTYSYDDAERTTTVTSPEGVVTTNSRNRHGQTIKVLDSEGYSEMSFDRNGQLLISGRYRADGTLLTSESREYEPGRGLLAATIDGQGRRVEFSYDAVGRVLRRVVDPEGDALATSYTYDGQGRVVAVTDPMGRITQQEFDREGRLLEVSHDPTGINLVTRYTYDMTGRTIALTEGVGTIAERTTMYEYDVLGRRIREVIDPASGGLELETRYAYDANDNVISRTDANGDETRFYYNEANQLTHQINPLGVVTRNWYDRIGQQVATRTFVVALSASELDIVDYYYDVDSLLTWDEGDAGEYRVYDGDGRLRFVSSLAGSVSEHRYGERSQLVSTREFANTFLPDGNLAWMLRDGSVDIAQLDTSFLRDDERDQLTFRIYDAAGRVRFSVNALGHVAETNYDRSGRVTSTVGYATPVSLNAPLLARLESGQVTEGELESLLTTTSNDQRSYEVLDGAGRSAYSINAAGVVVQHTHDAMGRIVQETRYANAVSLTSALRTELEKGNLSASAISAMIVPDAALDRTTSSVYDAGGRLIGSVDDAGSIRIWRYDALGRAIAEIAYVETVPSVQFHADVRNGLVTQGNLESYVDYTGMDIPRSSYHFYDAAGRRTLTVMSADVATSLGGTRAEPGAATFRQWRYDGVGRVLEDTIYGTALSNVDWSRLDGGDIATARQMLTEAANDLINLDIEAEPRSTRYYYDADGNLRFTIGPDGTVSESRFTALGDVASSHLYGQVEGLADDPAFETLSTLEALVGGGNYEARITENQYDQAGRLVRQTDALGYAVNYSYDGLGQLTSYQNRLGHTWTYGYDEVGRRIEEVSPQVEVATVDGNGVTTGVTRSIVTRTEYDSFGNLVTRIEDATSSAPRITRYAYDALGNQIRTIFPDAGVLNEDGVLVATGTMPFVEVTYDALGRAIIQRDVRGHYSQKLYDSQDRLIYEIDQEGYVTAYTYNAFGEQYELRRLSVPVQIANDVPISRDGLESLIVLGNEDRRIVTSYDKAGRVASVTQVLWDAEASDGGMWTYGATSQYLYDALGNLVVERQLAENVWQGGPDSGAVAFPIRNISQAPYLLWNETIHYYDIAGRRIATVDPESYKTKFQYDNHGQLTERTEFGRRLTQGESRNSSISSNFFARIGVEPPDPWEDERVGFDRVTRWEYDALGRRVVERSMRSHPENGFNLTILTEYDAEGRATTVTVNGSATETRFDALGRVTAVKESLRDVLRDDASTLLLDASMDLSSAGLTKRVSPFSHMAYDAFGNLVQVRRYANGVESGAYNPVASSRDSIQTTRYDWQGRAIWERDATGAVTTRQYDAADNLIRSRYVLTGNNGKSAEVVGEATYDKAGRQITSRVSRVMLQGGVPTGETVVDASSQVRYNAFGEIVAKDNRLDGALATHLFAVQFKYDNNGRLIQSNADGTLRNYAYNAAGHQIEEWHSVRRETSGGVEYSVIGTTLVVDRLGRAVEQHVPAMAHEELFPVIHREYDRWGNVITVTDQRGHVTRYEYNQANQLTREIRPEITTIDSSGIEETSAPYAITSYNGSGNVEEQWDFNHRWSHNEYDDAGRLQASIDTTGARTTYLYDSFGQLRLTQNAVGHITFSDYDAAGKVVAQGDFLTAPSGTVRSRHIIEQYDLNEQGNRRQVTDALGYVASYDYDSRGLVTRSRTAAGVVMEYAYDTQGNKIRETNALSDSSLVSQTQPYLRGGVVGTHYVVAGHNFSYSVPADAFAVPNGDALVVTARIEQGVVRNGVYVYEAVTAISWDPATGVLSGAVVPEGNYRIVLTASSTSGQSASAYLTVSALTQSAYDTTVAGKPVAVLGLYGQQANAGQPFSYQIPAGTFVDPQGQGLTYSASVSTWVKQYDPVTRTSEFYEEYVSLPASPGAGQWLAFDPVTRTLYGTPPDGGNFDIQITARDPDGNVTSLPVTLKFRAGGPVQITNSGFEAGSVGWDLQAEPGATLGIVTGGYSSGSALRLTGTGEAQDGSAFMNTTAAVSPGQSVTARAMIKMSNGTYGTSYAMVLVWYDASGNEISRSAQTPQMRGVMGSDWRQASYTATAPAGAATVKVGFYLNASDSTTASVIWVDNVTWNLKELTPGDGRRRTTDDEGEVVFLDEKTWDYDYFGRLIDHNDLSGADYDYEYDSVTGQLIGQSSSWTEALRNVSTPVQQIPGWLSESGTGWTFTDLELSSPNPGDPSRELSYYLNGLLKEVREGGNWTRFAYDDAGNRTMEETWTINPQGGIVHLKTLVTYDAHNRISQVTQDDLSMGDRRVLDLRYAYDAQGNRRRVMVNSAYNPQGGGIPSLPTNLDFELGDQEWSKGTGWNINFEGDGDAFSGSWSASYTGYGNSSLNSSHYISVQPGDSYSASVMIQSRNDSAGELLMIWEDANGQLIRIDKGPQIKSGYNWRMSARTASAPAGAATLRIGVSAQNDGGEGPVLVDNFQVVRNSGGDGSPEPNWQTYWYDYDSENRVTVVNGKLVGGDIVLGDPEFSYALSYDAAGRATQRRFMQNGVVMEQITQYDDRGQATTVFQARALGSNDPVALQDTFTYDAIGRQTEHRQYFGTNSVYNGTDITGWLKHAETTVYDADGRVLRQNILGRVLGWSATGTGNQILDLNVLGAIAAVDYGTYGYDEAGRLRAYSYSYLQHEAGSGAQAQDPRNYTHRYSYQYEGRDTYLEKQVYGNSTNTNFRASSSVSTYDAWGRRVAIRETTPKQGTTGTWLDDRIRYFAYDSDGNILQRREGTLTSAGTFSQTAEQAARDQIYAYVTGQQVAAGQRNGKADVLSRLTAYDTSDIGTVGVTVQTGDTLRGLAQRVYGNSNLWYVLAEANALQTDTDLVPGTTIKVPEVKVSANDANTFKPFDPGEAIGSTSPGLPYIEPPPQQSGCNVLAAVVMIVVAVVVTYFTAGAASSAFYGAGATLTAGQAAVVGAVAGAAGAAASNAVGSAMGATSFSWRNVAAGAVSGAVTGGFSAAASQGALGQTLQTSSWARAAASAVVGNIANYSANTLVGNQASFSWRSIAASAVSGAATSAVTSRVSMTMNLDPTTTAGQAQNYVIGSIVGGIVGAHTRHALLGEDLNFGQIAMDAFGNALGLAISGQFSSMAAAARPMQQASSARGAAVTAYQSDSASAAWAGADFAQSGDQIPTIPMGAAHQTGGGIEVRHGDNIPTLDVLQVVGYRDNPNYSTNNIAEWQWRMEHNAWVGDSPSYMRIPANATYEQARSIYHNNQALHRETNAERQTGPSGRPHNQRREGLLDLYLNHQADQLRMVQYGLDWFSRRSQGMVDGAESAWGAAAAGATNAINKATVSFAEGVVGLGRFVVDREYNTQARAGLVDFIRADKRALWDRWMDSPIEDKAQDALNAIWLGAPLAKGGSMARGALELSDVAGAGRSYGQGWDWGLPEARAPLALDDVPPSNRIDFVANSELTIASNVATGNPAAISRGFGTLNSRQAAVLEQLPEFGSSTIAHKSFGQRDLAALTAATGDEFAMFSTGGRRLIFRGDVGSVPINPDMASQLAGQGWRWSSHTHPGFEIGVLRSSPGDQAVLRAMGGNQSAIFNSMGQRGMFTPNGDSLNGWKPWW